MVISELIEKLREIQNKHGDVEIMYYFHGEGEKFTYYEIDYNKEDNKLYLFGDENFNNGDLVKVNDYEIAKIKYKNIHHSL